MKIAAVLPAFNEAKRIADVVRTVLAVPSIDHVIVVNDGSTDRTAEVVNGIPRVKVVNLPLNMGKGAAMVAGVDATDADVLLFLDADLIGLQREHVEALLAPVRAGRVQMSVGRFHGGRRLTDWSQKLAPNISGQRAILRDVFLRIPDIARTRYGVEMAITRYCRYYRVPTETVPMIGVTHPVKEEKIGWVRGCAARARMYCQIVRIVLDPRPPQSREVTPRRKSMRRFLRRLSSRTPSAMRGSTIPGLPLRWPVRRRRLRGHRRDRLRSKR